MLNQRQWVLSSENGYWKHGGSPDQPHAELTSGDHSSEFFNGGILCANSSLLDEATYDLITRAPERDMQSVNHVVGPAFGAIGLAVMGAYNVSQTFAQAEECFWSYTTKVTDDAGKVIGQTFDRITMPKQGDRVVIFEDTITTGTSTARVVQAVEELGATVVPFILALMNRSGLEDIDGRKIISLMRKDDMPKWEPGPETCPECRIGSKAIRPKGPAEWAQLTAQYGLL